MTNWRSSKKHREYGGAGRYGSSVGEWYAEVVVRFGKKLDPSSEEYTQTVERFYDVLSEYLGGEEFEPSMLCREHGLETYIYVYAESSEEAAALAAAPFRESVQVAWGPRTHAEVLRVMTSEERDLELEREEDGNGPPKDAESLG